jgi:RepB DNA-primase from phage plasmid
MSSVDTAGVGASALTPTIPQALKLQLAAFAGNAPKDHFLEIRPLSPVGRQEFIPVRDLTAAVAAVESLRDRHEVFIGAAPRVRPEGKAAAVPWFYTLFADCDSPDAVERLRAFRPVPSIVVRSGTGGRLHAYWPLQQPIPAAWAPRANRRLALALGSDRKCTDVARVMRAIGSVNRKAEPRLVECAHLKVKDYTVTEVVGTLEDDPADVPRRPAPAHTGSAHKALDGAARIVREAAEGGRNDALNWAAFRMGAKVAAGELDGAVVHDELRGAALQAGLAKAEVERTIESGLGAAA